MKPFVPARIVGGNIIAEREPFAFEATAHYRAIEVTEAVAERGSPYREAPPIAMRRVVVREPHEFVVADEHFLTLFQDSIEELSAFAGTPAPRVLHAFGRGEMAHAIVLEHIGGVSIERVLEALRARREALPVPVAVAIASELVALWRVPFERGHPVEINLGPGDIWITADGRVRAIPVLASERARQTVGAAVHMIEGNIAYISPEQIDGNPGPVSGMFTFGLLLYELLATAHPLTASSMFELLAQLRNTDLPPIAARRAVPREVAAFVARATARDPARRWTSWAALSAALAEVRQTLPQVGAADVLAALPVEARPQPEPPIDPLSLAGWRALPHDGLVTVRPRARGPQAPGAARVQARVDADLVYAGTDQRPMVAAGRLLVDVRPVTAAELQRFVLAMAAGAFQPSAAADTPCTDVSFEQAAAYAAWAGKRLPTDDEWATAVAAIGADRLATGSVWEWTTTTAQEGRVVRGGRWRNDLARPPSPENRSFETGPARDLGFRCVCDR